MASKPESKRGSKQLEAETQPESQEDSKEDSERFYEDPRMHFVEWKEQDEVLAAQIWAVGEEADSWAILCKTMRPCSTWFDYWFVWLWLLEIYVWQRVLDNFYIQTVRVMVHRDNKVRAAEHLVGSQIPVNLLKP